MVLGWWGRQPKGIRTAEAVVASDRSTGAGDPQNTGFTGVLRETGAKNAAAVKFGTDRAAAAEKQGYSGGTAAESDRGSEECASALSLEESGRVWGVVLKWWGCLVDSLVCH
jgi:hypothetical protein